MKCEWFKNEGIKILLYKHSKGTIQNLVPLNWKEMWDNPQIHVKEQYLCKAGIYRHQYTTKL